MIFVRLYCAALLAWAAPAAADEISVTQYGTSFLGVPYTVAQARGLFTEAGIDITGFIGSSGGGTTVRNLLASATQYGEVSVDAALAAAAQGLDILMVNVGIRSIAGWTVVTMPDSPVRMLDDLAGRKVAVTSTHGMPEMLLLMALQAKGVDASKVQRVASGGYVNGLTMLEQGAVAAATLAEPLSLSRGGRYRALVAAPDTFAPMVVSVGITTRAFAAAHPEKLRAIIAGRRAAVAAIYTDPAAVAAITAEAYALDPAVAIQAIRNMCGLGMWSLGNFDMAEMQRTVEALRAIGEVKEAPNFAELIDSSFLPSDLQPHS